MEWLEASGRITHLTQDEKCWWEAQQDIELFAEVICASDIVPPTEEAEYNEYVAEVGEFYLRINYVPQDELVDLVQGFFKRFRPNDCVTITWACQSGSYLGGGGCLISATEEKWNHTGYWAKAQEQDFYRRQGRQVRGSLDWLD